MPLSRRNALCKAAALSGWSFAGWLPGPARAQPHKDSLVISLSLEPSGLDPTLQAAASIGEVVHCNVFENLVRIEENGSLSGQLAHAWHQDASGLRYTFELRRDVVFHDGALMDAQAVRFSLERGGAPQSTNKAKKALFDNIARIDTPDPFTVVLTLHHADASTLFRLGESSAVILHPASAAQAATVPVGTGPYRFVRWQKGWGITLARSAHYRRAAQVQIEQVIFRFLPDPKAQKEAVQSGEIDLLFNIATSHATRFRNDPRYQVLIGASSGKGMLALNHRRAPLGDVRVRQAITHAIDREAFVKTVLNGLGRAIGSHFSPTDAGYVQLTSVYPFDPRRARALLKAAGVPLPLKLSMALPPTPYARTGGPFLAQALAQVGIEVRLQPLDWAQWLGGPFQGDFDMTLINHVEPLDYAIYTDPDYYFGYDSEEFRALVARHNAAPSARERNVLFAQIQRHLAADAVNAWIFAPQLSTVSRKGLKGVWVNYPIFVHDLAAMSWQ